jgi:hypothetical protein
VHLRDERAGCVDGAQPSHRRTLAHHGCHAVRGEDEQRPGRHVLLALDEDGAATLELLDDVGVVDDLPAHVDRRIMQRECSLDRLDGTFDPGAVPAGRGEEQPPHHGSDASSAARDTR